MVVIVMDNIIIVFGCFKDLIVLNEVICIDLGNVMLMFGLMDMYVYLISDVIWYGYKCLEVLLFCVVIIGVKYVKVMLDVGFIIVCNVGVFGFVDVVLRDVINVGDVVGLCMFVVGLSLGVIGGYCDSNFLFYEYDNYSEGVVDGLWEVCKKVCWNIKYGVIVIKFCVIGGVLFKGIKVGV